jgi:hypothetical protein
MAIALQVIVFTPPEGGNVGVSRVPGITVSAFRCVAVSGYPSGKFGRPFAEITHAVNGNHVRIGTKAPKAVEVQCREVRERILGRQLSMAVQFVALEAAIKAS